MRGLRKLILSILSLSFTLVSLITSTFAFVVMSSNVEVSAEFNIEGYEGLGISLDGNEFTQDITSEALKTKVAGSVDAYNALSFRGVTPKQDNSGKIEYVSNEAKFNYDIVSNLDSNGNIEKDSSNNVVYHHEFKDAVKNQDYLQFDLYFTALNSKDTNKSYDLFLVSEKPNKIGTSVTGHSSEVELLASLNTPATIDTRTGNRNSGPYQGTPYVPGEYKAKDKITLDPANAMRIGVTSTLHQKLNIYETPNSKDLGSSAIEGRTDDRHNKDLNAMYTYYNSWNILYPFTSAAADGEAFNTSDDYEKDANGDTYSLGVLSYISSLSGYNVIKVTLYIWLEGWDADYFLGVPVSARDLNINLVLELKERS